VSEPVFSAVVIEFMVTESPSSATVDTPTGVHELACAIPAGDKTARTRAAIRKRVGVFISLLTPLYIVMFAKLLSISVGAKP
jgi:hypothetical protein